MSEKYTEKNLAEQAIDVGVDIAKLPFWVAKKLLFDLLCPAGGDRAQNENDDRYYRQGD